MPTSNGQVTSRDIRQLAIRSNHIRDEAVETDALASLAVSIDKTSDPVWVLGGRAISAVDASLTTTYTQVVSSSLDVPSWVGEVSVLAIARLQANNTSGGVQGYRVQFSINGEEISGGFQGDVPNNGTGEVVGIRGFTISAPGSTITVAARAATVTGTNSRNYTYLSWLAVGTR